MRAIHRAVLRSRGLPGLAALYRGGYAGALALSARALHGLPGTAGVYLHRGMSREGWEPGVSDIDLILLLGEDGPAEAQYLPRLGSRLAGLRRLLPMLGDVWLGSPDELRQYARWGGLRAWEDAPDWRLVRGRGIEVPVPAQSPLKRRWLDPWVWVFVNHMEICRRFLRRPSDLPEKSDADLRKLYADVRRYAEFILAGSAAGQVPLTRAQAKQRWPEAAVLSARGVWLESSLLLARASRVVLAKTASSALGAAVFPEPSPLTKEAGCLSRLAAAPGVICAVSDLPYHTYLLLREGASERDYDKIAEPLLKDPPLGVPVALEPAAWALLLQSSYLGAPLGWLGGEGGPGPAGAQAPFLGWGACALGEPPRNLPLLPLRLRWETAAEAASWMALWWRALWISPGLSNSFVLYHLYTRALGLRLALDGATGGPFCDWELQSACLSARLEGERRPLARSRDMLLRETGASLDSCSRGELASGHLRALAGLIGGFQPALSAGLAAPPR